MAAPTARVFNLSTGQVLAREAVFATTFWSRFKGLMGKKRLDQGMDGLILLPCRGVHSFFMSMEIDVLFVGIGGEIVHIAHSLPKWSASRVVREAHYVVELPAGRAKQTGTWVGQRILLEQPEKTPGARQRR